MKIAVIGANGQLGSELCEQYSLTEQVIPLTHDQIEIGNYQNVKENFASLKPDVVINTAAYHNVPKCEENPELSFKINGIGALNLARCSEELDYKLVHFSTDYVFDGEKKSPYTEHDNPNPLNVYAATKLTGEYFVQNYCRKYFVIRISGIYGKIPCRAKGGNFITTMIKAAKERDVVKVVNDEVLTPTSVSAIAKNTFSLIMTDAFGLYHMTCEGFCSWYEFAFEIFKELALKTPLIPCSFHDFPMSVKRPTYSVLENQHLNEINLNSMPTWKDALVTHLKNYRLE